MIFYAKLFPPPQHIACGSEISKMICVGNNSKPLKQVFHCPNTIHSYRQHLSLLQESGEQGPGLGKDTILSQCKDILFEIIVLDFRTH